MKPDNANFSSDNRPCAPVENPLIRRPVGDVLQGAAADCNSGHKIAGFPRAIIALWQGFSPDNTPGQTENASGTLTTGFPRTLHDVDMCVSPPPGHDEPDDDRLPLMGWLLPCAVLGALLLAWGVWG